MGRLILFELEKIWKKPGNLAALALLLSLHIFLLWYTNLSDGSTPELSAYKAVQEDLEGMTEVQKLEYVTTLYENIQNINVVQDILMFQALRDDMREQLVQQAEMEHPGIFEAYYPAYSDGSYLKYTDSFEQEYALITELYEEITKVAAYPEYLDHIQKQKDNLSGISIFASTENNFSSRNIEKSAADYSRLTAVQTAFYPSKGIMGAIGSPIADILLLLAVLLLSGSLIYEEKEKRLFYITRASSLGRLHSVGAKLLALSVSVLILTLLIYGVNILYFAITTGIGNVFRSIQSAGPLMESCLPVNILTYCLLSILTKGGLLCLIGTLVTLVSILSKHSFMPYLVCSGILAASLLLYRYIPAYSALHWLKYLNVIGLLDTRQIYGSYMNFNLCGYPVSRLSTSLMALCLYLGFGIMAAIIAFLKCNNWELKKLRLPIRIPFHPHTSRLRHEGYKLLIMNRAGIVFLVFIACIGYETFSVRYHPSPAEVYYQSLMTQLEGPLTIYKSTLISSEQKRYAAAFQKIEQIDHLVETGQLSSSAGDSMKLPYYNETAFYPAFQRVLTQYKHIRETGGQFVYDTGYLYLFGLQNDTLMINLFLLLLCILLAFSNGMSMEYQKKSFYLLSASMGGRRSIYLNKIFICMGCAAVFSLVPWVFRLIHINSVYPLHGLLTPLQSIPAYHETGFTIPILLWILLTMMCQAIVVISTTLVTLCLSDRLKHHLPALAISTVILLLPLLLYEMGFDFTYWVSFLPLYRIPCLITEEHGGIFGIAYLIATFCIDLFCCFFLWKSCKNKK